MHFVYITAALPFSFGETFIIPEVLELQRRGHRLTIVPMRPGPHIFHEDARLLASSTIAEPLLSRVIIAGAFAQVLRTPRLALRSAALLVSSRSIPVLLKNAAVFLKALWLAGLVKRLNVDHIHAHFASTNATAALIASLVSGIPWSFTAHRWDISENNLLDKKAARSKFVRVIDANGGRELAALVGVYEYKVRVIHMGVDLRPSDPKPGRISGGPLRILLGARIDEFKGHQYAVDAVAQLKHAGVHVILQCLGEGECRMRFQDYARTLGVSDRVEFPGLRDHQKLLEQLRDNEWDVAILPSIESAESREGIPVVLIEAMAAEVPVIATNTGGIPELLHGGAGVLIPQQDAKSIADELKRIATSAELRRQLAEAGIRRVRAEFSVESTVSALLAEFVQNPP